MKRLLICLLLTMFLSLAGASQSYAQNGIKGSVKDQNGDAIAGATVTIRTGNTGIGMTTATSRDGEFLFESLPAGEYGIRVSADGFAAAHQDVRLTETGHSELVVTLAVGESHITVAAEVGQSEEAENIPQAVNVIGSEEIMERVKTVMSQAAKEEPGLNVQATSPTIGAIVIRGLTGKNVANFVDGVRYTHSGQRGGINTFFNLNDPSNFQTVDVIRGPNGAQYGSDSLAGAVNLVSKTPAYGFADSEFHGEFNPAFSSAEKAFGSNAMFSYGSRRFGGYVNLQGRCVGDVRTAGGNDSHSAITRFLGLPSTVLYDVNPDTGFQQYGGSTRLDYSPRDDHHLTFYYQRGQQDDGKRFDQLLGGDGNLIADLRNLMLDFGYLRYVKTGFGPFDSASFTGSYNSQREERVNQGGQGNPTGDITHQYERTSVFGGSFYLDKRFGTRNTLVIGGDYYHEGINSPAYIHNPVSNAITISRPRVPDDARFSQGGIFVQDSWEAIPDRLRITGAFRYSGMSYKVDGANSPVVNGRQLWLSDELSTSGPSGRIGAVVRATEGLRFAFNYSRGFRYPSMTDLGTLGLTGDGYEVDHITANSLNGTIGSTPGADAVSTGLAVEQQESEFSNNFDASIRYSRKRFETSFTAFRLDINNAITKQALILPQGAVGTLVGSEVITSQLESGVVFVAAATNPVLVRTNFTDAKLWGVEYELKTRLTDRLTLRGNYTYIRAADKVTDLPPNIEGGTPPPTGFIGLRYDWSRFWVEGYSTLAYRQERLSAGDLADRRTGAARSRSQIANYIRRGACVAGLTVNQSGTGCGVTAGNPVYVLVATGETLAQVQDRLLPGLGNNVSVPLFTHLPGYGIANIRGGFTINERANIFLSLENIFDHYYRNPSWGIDGTGRSFTAQFRYKF